MTFVLNKINRDSEKVGTTQQKQVDKGTGNYSLEINLTKNAVIVYEINKDKSTEAIKVFPASIGKELTKGKHNIKEKYSWVKEDDDWHQYCVKFANMAYIQSVSFENKYPYTLKHKSYNKVGKKIEGNDIVLYSKDARWIYENCKVGVKLNIVKGKKSDKLPLSFDSKIELNEYCGWDPTDSNENNPYKKVKNGEITLGIDTIYIEKGTTIKYYANILLLDTDGKDITNTLKYKKISTEKIGNYKIKYTLKNSDGSTKKVTQKVTVVDTTPPVVSCSRSQFSYQVDGRSSEDMNTEDNVKAIENMVRQYVSVNETGCTITVRTVGATELLEDNFTVSIKAQDESGNVGSCNVMCQITVKKSEGSNKNTPEEKINQIIKDRKEEETTKKKKTSKKDDETEVTETVEETSEE